MHVDLESVRLNSTVSATPAHAAIATHVSLTVCSTQLVRIISRAPDVERTCTRGQGRTQNHSAWCHGMAGADTVSVKGRSDKYRSLARAALI
eukprot:2118615-Rhodomonas_salina.3